MKVQIKNLEPNPFRDINNYPMNEVKLARLERSIKKHGFWDNVLARPHPEEKGKFQIAYGHHRRKILIKVYKPDDKVDIPVKDLTDAQMIQCMAEENDSDYATNPAIINETVKAAKQFLDEHPEEVKKLPDRSGKGHHDSKEAFQIAEFLDWPESRVYSSLVALNMISTGVVEKEIIENMPNVKAQDRFIRAVKKHETPIEKQRIIADRLHKEDSFSEQSISDTFSSEKYTTPKKKQEYQSEKIIKYESYVAGIRNRADELFEDLKQLVKTEKELGEISENIYRKLLEMSLSTLSKQIEIIIKKEKNEKVEFANTNPASITG